MGATVIRKSTQGHQPIVFWRRCCVVLPKGGGRMIQKKRNHLLTPWSSFPDWCVTIIPGVWSIIFNPRDLGWNILVYSLPEGGCHSLEREREGEMECQKIKEPTSWITKPNVIHKKTDSPRRDELEIAVQFILWWPKWKDFFFFRPVTPLATFTYSNNRMGDEMIIIIILLLLRGFFLFYSLCVFSLFYVIWCPCPATRRDDLLKILPTRNRVRKRQREGWTGNT